MNGEEDRGHISYPLIAGRLGKEGDSAWQTNIRNNMVHSGRPLRIAHELMIDRQGRRKYQTESGRRERAYMLPGVLYCNKE